MIVENKQGLTPAQIQQVEQPFARNDGRPVNYQRAAAALDEFDRDNPDLWAQVGRIMDKKAEKADDTRVAG